MKDGLICEKAFDEASIPHDLPSETHNPVFGDPNNPTFNSFGGGANVDEYVRVDKSRKTFKESNKSISKEENRDSLLGDSSPEDGRVCTSRLNSGHNMPNIDNHNT